jgi:riboflavin kinase/FMN adenylyltransferase
MKHIIGIEAIEAPFPRAVVAIGNFDGVHIGHQAIFHVAQEKAHAIDGTAVAVTFEPHPIRVLKQNGTPPLITLHQQKAELIERAGMDALITIPFTNQFADIPARTFVRNILVDTIGLAAIVVGKDYTFGKNREGDLSLLLALSREIGFEVVPVDWIRGLNNGSGRISSTRVRQFVEAGRVEDAKNLLGRFYQIRGRVVAGRNRGGKLLGIPTANIQLTDELCPKTGIYAVTVEISGNRYPGAANIGYSPTFDDHKYTVEIHILDFNQNIYGQEIRVNFIKRIRDEKKFAGVDELGAQIRRDIETARRILSELQTERPSCSTTSETD